MKSKILFIGIFIVLFIPLVFSLGETLPLACAGNSQVIVGCLNSVDLIWLGTAPPTEHGGQLDPGTTPDDEEMPPPIIIKKKELPFFSIANLNEFLFSKGLGQLDIYILEIMVFGIFVCFIFLVYKRRKKEKGEKKREKDKNEG